MSVWQIVVLALLLLILAGFVWYGWADGEIVMWSFLGLLLTGIAATLVVMIPIWSDGQARWEAWCHDNGGRVTSHTDTTSSTTYYCLSADGRVLDIR